MKMLGRKVFVIAKKRINLWRSTRDRTGRNVSTDQVYRTGRNVSIDQVYRNNVTIDQVYRTERNVCTDQVRTVALKRTGLTDILPASPF